MQAKIKNILAILVVLLVVYTYLKEQGVTLPGLPASQISVESSRPGSLKRAIDNQLSDIQVEGAGKVSKLLRDDLSGSRHQRFILKLDDNRSLLVAHNIDLAPKIESLRKGDRVDFYGEYEWNNKGGVLHWTHHDPGGRHIDGWLEHKGKRYQ